MDNLKTWPQEIYLGSESEDTVPDFSEFKAVKYDNDEDINWYVLSQWPQDIKYIRADFVNENYISIAEYNLLKENFDMVVEVLDNYKLQINNMYKSTNNETNKED